MRPSILFIVPAEYEALKIKGVENMIYERAEGGFFKKVITLHPFCSKTQTIKLNDCHEIHEVGFDLIPGAKKWRILKYIQFPIHFFRIILTAITLAQKNNVDLIRANDPYWIGLFGFLTSKFCNIPFCVSIHADHDKRMELDREISMSRVFGSYKLAKRLEAFIFSKANLILPIRKSLGKKAEENGADPKKIKIIPHGIDLSYFSQPSSIDVRSLFKINPELKIVSFVGRLVHENYIKDILTIASKLSAKRNDFVIVMAGGGKEESFIKTEIAKDPQLSKFVMLVGFQPKEVCLELRKVSEASLCLMGGFSLIEASAAAKPVIAYDVEWHSELVVNHQTGFLLQEFDTDSAVLALDWIFDHPTQSAQMGLAAKSLAYAHHELEHTSSIKRKYYSELLTEGESYVS